MINREDITLCETPYVKQASIYYNPHISPRACVLYFHGGGLLYGSRSDLPKLHLEKLTGAGYLVISYDYPLAPSAKLDLIMSDVTDSVNSLIRSPQTYIPSGHAWPDAPAGPKGSASGDLPFYLWGRSAGAYLCLMAAAGGKLKSAPRGILSYYGYGFLCDNWFGAPNSYYCSLPSVPDSCLSAVGDGLYTTGALDTHYSLYVYARQKGLWKTLLYTGRDKYFFLNHSLRTCSSLPCPLFCAHSINDTDVPYSEFLELCAKYNAQRFVASKAVHDFDRDESDPFTEQLLDATLHFMDSCLS